MAFIIEKIPETEKKKFPFINIKLSSRWAIDREREVFIAITGTVGGPYEGTVPTDYYTMYWHNEKIDIAATPLPKSFTERGAIMNWHIHGLEIPETLQDRKESVFQLIRDAFSAIGQSFDGDRFLSVNVEFDRPTLNK